MDTNYELNFSKEHLKTVIVGHVDHGKSTIIGRLLADTNSLPEGKLEGIKESCRKNSKPFEYAFLLDALENEQNQGITIDMARCFLQTEKRNYIIIDAPGHIEFLKNMLTGAAKADSALLVIDAKEGIQENSKRHGYMLSMLGVKQIAILVNKFDLVDYDKKIFDDIVTNYTEFLDNIGVTATNFIPVSGMAGDNIKDHSPNTSWYTGPTVLDQLELFHPVAETSEKAFRMPVQDIYKFTNDNDDRRIVAGTIESGTISVGDEVVFLPSGKESTIKNIEGFNTEPTSTISAPHASGFTLTTQIYIKSGELMCKKEEEVAEVGTRFRVNLFWLRHSPMVKGKKYKLKIGAAHVTAELVEILNVLDASELSSVKSKDAINRHDVGECIIETTKPIAFDFVNKIEGTARFVLVDDYDIAGGGIIISKDENSSILEERIAAREISWESGLVTSKEREVKNRHKGKSVVITGSSIEFNKTLAKKLERKLFDSHLNSYYLGVSSIASGLDIDIKNIADDDEEIRRFGELSRIMTDAGIIVISALNEVDDYELEKLKLLNSPNELLVVNVGTNNFSNYKVDVNLSEIVNIEQGIWDIMNALNKHKVIPEYCI